MSLLASAFCCGLACAGAVVIVPQPQVPTTPIVFVENRGQWDSTARFIGQDGATTIRLEDRGFSLHLREQSSGGRQRGAVVRFTFVGSQWHPAVTGKDAVPTSYNFFLGTDPSRWQSRVPGLAEVTYEDLYPGIGLCFHGGRDGIARLEYDLRLDSGADLDAITVRCDGIDGMHIAHDGRLALDTAMGPIYQSAPKAWQTLPSGATESVECLFRLIDATHFGFEAESRDPQRPLLIDPGLEWSTYVGGSLDDIAVAIEVSATGDVLVVSRTGSSDFPITPGSYDTTYNGANAPFFCCDVALSRYSGSGGTLLSATYLGGQLGEYPEGLACDASGFITVSGCTGSPDFPVTSGALNVPGASGSNIFATRLDPQGSTLIWSAILGADFGIDARSMALDPQGGVFVVGGTSSSMFPVTPDAFDKTKGANGDGFIVHIDATGSELLYASYLGGDGADGIDAIAVDPSGEFVIAGLAADGVPVFPSSFEPNSIGIYMARFSADGRQILASTYLGGEFSERAKALAIDDAGNVVVVGWTGSFEFPTTADAFDPDLPTNLGKAGFVTRFDPFLSQLIDSTFLVGGLTTEIQDVAVDSAAVVTVSGFTYGSVYPATPGAYDTTPPSAASYSDLIVTRLSPDLSTLYYSTFIGGSQFDGGTNTNALLAVDSTGSVALAASTDSLDFPVTPGAFQPFKNGGADGVVVKFDMLPTGVSKYGASSPSCLGKLALGVTAMPKVGATNFGVTCTNAPPFSSGGLLPISLQGLQTPSSAVGTAVWVAPTSIILLLPVSSNNLGFSLLPLLIPNNPSLAGFSVYGQFFWQDPCGPAGWSASNALVITVQP